MLYSQWIELIAFCIGVIYNRFGWSVNMKTKENTMKKFINSVCMPLTIIAAINCGVMAVSQYNIFYLIPDATRAVMIIFGIAGLFVAYDKYIAK